MEFCKNIKPLSSESEWPIWKRKIRDVLDFYEGALDVIDKKITKPGPLSEDATEAQIREHKKKAEYFRKANSYAKTIITSCITDQIYQKIMDKDGAFETWQALKNIFEATSRDQLFKICSDLFGFTWQDNEDVSTHISKIRNLWDELNNGLKMKGEHKLPDMLLVCKILHILPKNFEMFRSNWMMMSGEKDKTIEELSMQLCMFERNFKSNEAQGERDSQQALKVNVKNDRKEKYNKKDDVCNYCKKKGHWLKDCRKWIADGKPTKNKTGNVNNTTIALPTISSDANLVNTDMDWWFDNGATRHITKSFEIFSEFQYFDQPQGIQAAGKEYLKAVGTGVIPIVSKVNGQQITMNLENVWYVPDVSKNLFSVLSAQDRNPNSEFKSTTTRCSLTVNGNIVLCGQRSRNGSLYKADLYPCRQTENVNISVNDNSTLQLFHERWGHQDKRHVKEKLEKEIGINVKYSNEVCEPCVYGKLSRLPFGRRQTATAPGELMYTDVCGPFPPSFKGFKYLIVFKDDFTKYRYGYIVKHKSDVKDSLLEMLANAKQQGHAIKTLLSDNGGEFNNADVKKILMENGINQKLTAPYTPQQNGGAERENRTIVEMARTFKYSNPDAAFPEAMWAEFVKSAIYILNRTGKSSIPQVSPFELWCGKKPRIRHLRIIGSSCYVHLPSQKRKKMDKKAVKGYLVGYDGDERYRIYIKEQQKVEISRDVKFQEKVVQCENKNQVEIKGSSEDVKDNGKSSHEKQDGVVITYRYNRSDEDATDVEGNDDLEMINSDPSSSQNHEESDELVQEEEEDDMEDFEGFEEQFQDAKDIVDVESVKRNRIEDSDDEEPLSKRLRDRTLISNPRYDDFIMVAQNILSEIQTPTTYNEAIQSIQKEEWTKAMQSEINSLLDNNTWVLTSLPKGSKALPGRWVFRVKMKPDGSIEKYKARLVIKGFAQKKGVDYDQTFSPVAKMTTIRSLISVAASEELYLAQFDVSTAFLYGELNETIYMKQPEGFDDGSGRVCQLKRSLYGLKQAPRCWNKRMGNFLVKNLGLKASTADPCLFIREKDGKKLILALYVDDGLVAASDKNELDIFLNELKSEFKIEVKDVSFFLGLEIERKDNGIKISQKAYANKILQKFNFSECKSVSTPMDKVTVTSKPGKANVEFPYRQAVGALMYLMLGTRPDLAYAVGFLSRFLENPSQEDVQRVKRVFRYISGTLDVGITYNKNGPKSIECFSDADFGGCLKTGRSTSGVVVIYAGGAISWLSQRQQMVATSTTEAEIVAANEAAKEVIWLKRLFGDVNNFNQVPIVQIDNTAALRLAQNPEFHRRTKHIAIKHFFIREKVTEGQLQVAQVSSEEQVADMMTKPLAKMRLRNLCNRLNLC